VPRLPRSRITGFWCPGIRRQCGRTWVSGGVPAEGSGSARGRSEHRRRRARSRHQRAVDLYVGRQDHIDKGLVPGLSSVEKAELAAAKKRIVELETELAISRRAMELLRVSSDPKGGFSAVAVMAAEKPPVQVACRVVGVSESGY